MNEVIICVGLVFALGVFLIATVAWDIFRTLVDIKFELEDMNRELKSKKGMPWNYTTRALEAAIKHE
jgi:hypothetical protein